QSRSDVQRLRGFKNRALDEVRKFAEQQMGTRDVHVDTRLNKFLWSKGIS
uniref:Uncharacterized protein n=1 Tax=Parascaris univalens TaxID=6257 RepID=A0A915C4W8_PARUN